MVLKPRILVLAMFLAGAGNLPAQQSSGPQGGSFATPQPSAEQARLGFALACSEASCRSAGSTKLGWVFLSAPRVAALRTGSPAEQGGLAVGDRILAINGRAIEGLTTEALKRYLLGRDPISFRVLRNAREVNLVVRPGN